MLPDLFLCFDYFPGSTYKPIDIVINPRCYFPSGDASIIHLRWEKSIKIVKSLWKNDINYCKSLWKNVSLHQESPHYLVRADGYY